MGYYRQGDNRRKKSNNDQINLMINKLKEYIFTDDNMYLSKIMNALLLKPVSKQQEIKSQNISDCLVELLNVNTDHFKK